MSFSAEVKNELARTEPQKKCCQLAEIAGFLRVAGSIRLAGGGKMHIAVSTDNAAIARHYKRLIKEYFKVDTSLSVGEGGVFKKGYRYTLSIGPEDRSEQILRETGILLVREGNNYISDGIYDDIIKTKCCRKSYLRGIFLGAGSVSDPEKSYHLEIVCTSRQLSQDLKKLINTFEDLSAKTVLRKNKHVVYIKSSAYIRDTLAIMGATSHVFIFEDVMIKRQMMNQLKRIINCDDANTDRVVEASRKQIDAIERLKASDKYRLLSDKLRDIAELRTKHPEASISQLGEMLDPPLKKSGVNNRLKKLMEIADSVNQ